MGACIKVPNYAFRTPVVSLVRTSQPDHIVSLWSACSRHNVLRKSLCALALLMLLVQTCRPVPKEYLHSAELRDIMQFGSSSTAVFFKMRVAGVLHIFQFETRQGEDICMALQTHINDIMMKRCVRGPEGKAVLGLSQDAAFSCFFTTRMTQMRTLRRWHRYSKAKASASAEKASQQLGLSQGNFGPKYEAHVAQLQQELEELRKKIQIMQRQETEIR